MKKLIYIMFLLMSNLSFSQKITLNDLIYIHVHKIDEANNILSDKGWDLNEVSDDNASLTSWSYKKSELETTKAKSFITKFYQKEYDTIADFTSNSRTFSTFNLGVRFEFSSSNKQCLSGIMNNIKQYNMKKIVLFPLIKALSM